MEWYSEATQVSFFTTPVALKLEAGLNGTMWEHSSPSVQKKKKCAIKCISYGKWTVGNYTSSYTLLKLGTAFRWTMVGRSPR
jgi:hypothetical protein